MTKTITKKELRNDLQSDLILNKVALFSVGRLGDFLNGFYTAKYKREIMIYSDDIKDLKDELCKKSLGAWTKNNI